MRWFAGFALLAFLVLSANALPARTWTSAGGQHTIDAELVEVDQGRAVLREPDGQLYLVEIAKLSAADQQHLKQLGLYDGPIATAVPAPPAAGAPAGEPAPAAAPVVDPKELLPDVLPLLRVHEMDSAKAKVDFYRGVRADGSTKDQIAKTVLMYVACETLWTAFREGVPKLQAGGELQVGKEAVLVVEATDELLAVRVLGRTCRFQVDAPGGIPAKLMLAVVDKTSRKTPELATAIEWFKALDSAKNDPSRWQIAAGPGPNVPFESLLSSATPGPGASIPQPLPATPRLPAPPVKKLAVPDASARDKARNEVRELFKKEFEAARTGQQKNDLARQFSKLAHETYPQEPATCFALIQEAIELTSGTGNASGAMFLVDWLVTRYQIDDPLRVKAIYLLKAAKAGGSIDGKYVGEQGLALMEEAAQANRFEVVEMLGQPAAIAARQAGERDLADKITARKTALESLKAAAGELQALKQALAANPDDPAANEKLGLIVACIQQDWPAGLAHLAKAADPTLAAAAKADAAGPTEAAKQVAAGDAWWNLAESAALATYQTALKQRAVHWYQQALPGLSGLAKLKVEKRIKGE